MFLCIFTNFFLVLLREKGFLMLLLCIFTNRKKMQSADQTLQAVCRQQHSESLRTAYTDEHFSRQKVGIPSAANFFSSYFFTGHHTFRPTAYFLPVTAGKHLTPPFIFSYRANLSLTVFNNLHFRQPLSTFTPSVIQLCKHSVSPFSINLPQKN